MLISVLIPTYNRAGMLEKCIESVLRQTYKYIEIVVSDNASDDNTEALMKELTQKYSNIRYYRNNENIGLTGNFSRLAYDLAKGEYGIFLSDDDEFYDAEYLEKFFTLNKKYQHQRISFAFSNCINDYVDSGYTRLHTKANIPEFMFGLYYFNNFKKTLNKKKYLAAPLCTTIFNLEVFKDIKAFDGGDDLLSLDLMAWLKMSMVGNILYINTVASLYRVHSKNTCNSSSVNIWFNNAKYLDEVKNFAIAYIPKKKAEHWYKRNRCKYYQGLTWLLFNFENRYRSIKLFISLIRKGRFLPDFIFLTKYLLFLTSRKLYFFLKTKL